MNKKNYNQNHKKIDLIKNSLPAVMIFLILIFGGSVAYSKLEGWRYLDALYFTVVTVTTIGYGDVVPQTDIGKIFTMVFPFVGIAMVFYLFSIIGKHVFRRAFEIKIMEHLHHVKPNKNGLVNRDGKK